MRQDAPDIPRQHRSVVSGLNCPLCGRGTKVVNSRPHIDGTVRRRRACESCGSRFSTAESRIVVGAALDFQI